MRDTLTPRDKDIVEYVESHILKYGYAPTYREIGEGVGINSTASIKEHLSRIIALGALETSHECSPRALRSPRIKMAMTKG